MIKKPSRLALLSKTAVGSIAFVGILAIVALIGQHHPLRLDLTESKRYSISEQSQKIVRSLTDDIHIKAFFQDSERTREEVRDLLETYRYHSKRVRYEFIDPDREPNCVECHSPHEIRKDEKLDTIRYEVKAGRCLVCHGDPAQIAPVG